MEPSSAQSGGGGKWWHEISLPLFRGGEWGGREEGEEMQGGGDHDEEERKICDSRCLHGKYVRPALAVAVVKVCENSRIPPSSPPPPQR